MPDGLGDDLSRMSFGTGSPAEMADQPSGLGQVAGGMYTGLGELAKQMFGESENLRAGRGYNAGPAVQTTLGAMGGPLVGGARAAAEGGVALGSGPIKAYHSSPHQFDKFDTSRIGTGEGAQVYGHGLYFAENPKVSGQGGEYWNQFVNRFKGPEFHAAHDLADAGFDRAAVVTDLQKEIAQIQDHMKYAKFNDPLMAQADREYWQKLLTDKQARYELLASGKPVGPRTYEVDINADPAKMLNWDKAIAEQPSAVQDVYREMFPQGKASWGFEPKTGADFHRAGAAELAQGTTVKRDPARLAATLNEAGVPGIRYLDEGSRSIPADRASLERDIRKAIADGNRQLLVHYQSYLDRLPQPTSNYVVFDPSIIDIRKVYGVGSDAGLGNAFAASMMSRHPEQFLPPQQPPVTRENLT